MNQAIALFTRLASNPHTSISGIVFAACKFLSIWFPQYKQQLEATEGLALGYGLMMAGDSGTSNVKVRENPATEIPGAVSAQMSTPPATAYVMSKTSAAAPLGVSDKTQ